MAGDLWEPALDPAEWPEMREYVSTAELNAYEILYNAAADAEAAKIGGARTGNSGGRDVVLKSPPVLPRMALSLNDLRAAEAARAVGLPSAEVLPLTNAEGGRESRRRSCYRLGMRRSQLPLS